MAHNPPEIFQHIFRLRYCVEPRRKHPAFAGRRDDDRKSLPCPHWCPPLQTKINPRGGDPRDAEIGQRVRTLRLERGLSQTELGKLISVTFQQVQKYEKGMNRISAGRLQRIAEVLGVPISFFFTGFDKHESAAQDALGSEFSFLQTEGALRLARAYARIKQPGVRLHLLRLTEAIAGD
jgi:transcriptional regulator with XRE-family HTH domain